jgi:hypothetical protein
MLAATEPRPEIGIGFAVRIAIGAEQPVMTADHLLGRIPQQRERERVRRQDRAVQRELDHALRAADRLPGCAVRPFHRHHIRISRFSGKFCAPE